MRVRNLNGDLTNWKPHGTVVAADDPRSRSTLHLKARRLLYSMFPTIHILEEVPVRPRDKALHFDFYLSNLNMVVEVHGQQHYKFNSLYHSSAQDFINQKRRDTDKREWCEINNIYYIELAYDEDEEAWRNKIIHR